MAKKAQQEEQVVLHERDTTAEEKTASVPGVVNVPADDLKAIMARLDKLEKENRVLTEAADRARLAKAQMAEDGEKKLIPQVRLSTLEGDDRIIVAWKVTANESYVDNGRLVERQAIALVFEDGSMQELPYIEFVRKQQKKVIGEIVGRTTDTKTGKETLTLELRDGKRMEIGIDYVN